MKEEHQKHESSQCKQNQYQVQHQKQSMPILLHDSLHTKTKNSNLKKKKIKTLNNDSPTKNKNWRSEMPIHS